jgi:dTDP-4-dehydrorhamnose reductase
VALSYVPEYGVFHCAGLGGCSWFNFAVEIFRQTNVPCKISVLNKVGELVRSKYLVLENRRLHQLDINVMKPWQEELSGYLKETQQ